MANHREMIRHSKAGTENTLLRSARDGRGYLRSGFGHPEKPHRGLSGKNDEGASRLLRGKEDAVEREVKRKLRGTQKRRVLKEIAALRAAIEVSQDNSSKDVEDDIREAETMAEAAIISREERSRKREVRDACSASKENKSDDARDVDENIEKRKDPYRDQLIHDDSESISEAAYKHSTNGNERVGNGRKTQRKESAALDIQSETETVGGGTGKSAHVDAQSAQENRRNAKRAYEEALEKAKSDAKKKSARAVAKAKAKKKAVTETTLRKSRAEAAAAYVNKAKAAKDGANVTIGGAIGTVAPIVGIVILSILIAVILIVSISKMMEEDVALDAMSASEAQVAQFLLDKGLDATHVASIMGNIRAESGGAIGEDFNVGAEEGGFSAGHGLCQWTGSRFHGMNSEGVKVTDRNLMDFAASLGKNWTDIEAQLEFFWLEFTEWTGSRAYFIRQGEDPPAGTYVFGSKEAFANATDVPSATKFFCYGFEAPGIPHESVRVSYAQTYYALMTSGVIGGGDVVDRARSQLGKPYLWGACGPDSFDCSGLVGYALTGTYTRIGTTETFMGWPRVDGEPQPGDICTSMTHCGIYIGGGQMIHAPQTGDVVKIGPVQDSMIFVRYPG